MFKKTIIFFFISFFSTFLFAQRKQGQALVDSLKKELKIWEDSKGNKKDYSQKDTIQVDLLNSITRLLTAKGDFASAKKYLNESFNILDKINFPKGKAVAYTHLGTIYNNQEGNYPEALKNHLIALKINEEINNKSGQSNNYMSIGLVYWKLSNFSEALRCTFTSIKIQEDIGEKKNLANAYNNIGIIYKDLGNYPEALKYIFISLKKNEENKNKIGQASNYNNIAQVYISLSNYQEALKNIFNALKIREELGDKKGISSTYIDLGNTYHALNNNSEALKYLFEALKIKKEIDDKRGIAIVCDNIADIYQSQKNYPETIKYYSDAFKIHNEIGDLKGLANFYNNIGKLNIQFKNYDTAQRQLDSALLLGKTMRLREQIVKSYDNLANLDSVRGNWLGAYFHHQQFIKYRDSLINEQNTKKITQTTLQYEFDKKQDSIKLVSQKRELALQKELEIKQLQYEYDKKQAAAKSEKERQQLRFEQQLKQQQIEAEYAQKEAKLEAEQQQKEEIAKLNQEKKDAIAKEEIKRQQTMRNFSLLGLAAVLLFLGIVIKQRNKVKEEKQRSDDLLLNILPSEVAEELKTNGATVAKQFNNVSVLFTDFVGFTKVSEELSPTQLVAEIHKYFTAFDTIIEKNGLEKIKTIGDAYLAVCGLPNEDDNHARKTVQAALEIREYINNNNCKFEIRIGISSGSVVAGIVGFKKFAYDIWGDTVNTAARMEQNSEAGKINISQSTYELVETMFKCEYRGKIKAKNKGEIDMYFVD